MFHVLIKIHQIIWGLRFDWVTKIPTATVILPKVLPQAELVLVEHKEILLQDFKAIRQKRSIRFQLCFLAKVCCLKLEFGVTTASKPVPET